MLAVSDRFLDALRESHQISVAAFLFRPTALATPVEVRVVEGTIDANRDARVLRQGSLTIAYPREDAATAALVSELPFGGYCTIERGIRYADGTIERVQLGRFRVESAVIGELTGTAVLALADRFAQVADEPFATPYAPAGKHPSDAVVEIVSGVFGASIAYHVLTTPGSEPLIAGTVYDQDRTEAISDLCSGIGADALFDAQGDFVIRPSYAPHPPVWTVDGGERGVLVSAETTLDRSSVRNGVSMRGQAAPEAPPLYGLAVYDEPGAPLRWGGPFGRVVLVAESTTIETQAQADAAAASLLNLRLALSRTLALESIPNPALEPDDVIEIVYPDGRTAEQVVNETHIGLGADAPISIVTTDRYAGEFSPSSATVRTLHGAEAARELALATVGVDE